MSSITCEPKTLAAALAAVKPCANTKSANQALSGVKINTHVDGVFLRTTNMDVHAMRRIDATVNGSLECVAPLALLIDAVNLVKNRETVTLTHVEKRTTVNEHRYDSNTQTTNTVPREYVEDELVVASGNRTITLRTLRLEDFPAMPNQGGRVILQSAGAELTRVLERAGKFNSRDETRPILTGLDLSWQNDRLELAATDSYRLAVLVVPGEQIVSKVKNETENHVTIGPGVLIAGKAMKNAETVTLLSNEEYTIIEFDDMTFAVRNIDGQYPDWRQLMPDGFEHEVTIPVAALAEACDMAVKFCLKNAPARLWVNGTVKLHGSTPDVGGFEEILEGATATMSKTADGLTAEGSLEIGLNPEFLRDVVKVHAGETTTIRLRSPLRPALFEDGEDRFLLMPIRLSV